MQNTIMLLGEGVDVGQAWLTFIGQVGISAGIAVFLVKWMTSSYTALDKFVREELMVLINNSNKAIAENSKLVDALIRTLADKPCLYELEKERQMEREREAKGG